VVLLSSTVLLLAVEKLPKELILCHQNLSHAGWRRRWWWRILLSAAGSTGVTKTLRSIARSEDHLQRRQFWSVGIFQIARKQSKKQSRQQSKHKTGPARSLVDNSEVRGR
jgi:hypothetical protein